MDNRLWTLLDEQREYLRGSAAAFDGGYEAEAKRLVVAVRTLVHDTRQSKSLLGQLDLKASEAFASMQEFPAELPPGTYRIGDWSMMSLKIIDHVATYSANTGSPALWLPFDAWWEMPVLDAGSPLSRCELVLALANKDGGAHVDRLPESYDDLSNRNKFLDGNTAWGGLQFYLYRDDEGRQRSPSAANSLVLVTMRTIAHEVLLTLGNVERLTLPGWVEPDYQQVADL
ncbi:hypothetical protein [Rathayibacter sp. Leaf248]|uniref:hypothetical protein n=1 Tax=Rathayibacter sp. Leaf248 TaxID=2876555 RepID=UPI001E34A916|nr:hypothetical protein [Rathayibacter sp. Leaf248]